MTKLLILTTCVVLVFMSGYQLGTDNRAKRDEAVRQQLLHEMDKMFFSICQDIKGDVKTYKKVCS